LKHPYPPETVSVLLCVHPLPKLLNPSYAQHVPSCLIYNGCPPIPP
jgi:hypothetical protein